MMPIQEYAFLMFDKLARVPKFVLWVALLVLLALVSCGSSTVQADAKGYLMAQSEKQTRYRITGFCMDTEVGRKNWELVKKSIIEDSDPDYIHLMMSRGTDCVDLRLLGQPGIYAVAVKALENIITKNGKCFQPWLISDKHGKHAYSWLPCPKPKAPKAIVLPIVKA